MKKTINILLTLVLLGTLFSCSKDALDPTLAQDKAISTSINTLEDMQGLLLGAYNRMTSHYYYGRNYIIYGEIRSDNCFSNGNSGRFTTVAAMKMGDDDGYAAGTWAQIYRVIASANVIIKQDPEKITGDPEAIKNIIGQAYAIRALAHFDLLKLYGQQNVTGGTLGVPYVTTFKGDDLSPARKTVAEDKTMINADFEKALSLMDPDLNDPSREFITTYAVEALQSRVDVYFGDWDAAKTACEKVINSGDYEIAPAADYAKTFSTKGAKNVIFELAQRPTDNAGINGLSYIYRGDNYGDIEVLPNLPKIFDSTDVRIAPDMIANVDGKWRNIGKYPTNANFDYDIPIIRYEEVILNYAEALYHLGDDAKALTELNLIPAHRDAKLYTTISEDNILLERRKELCFEGFRFDDLARTHQDIPDVDPFYQTHGLVKYGDYRFAFPIPIGEINANPNMVQNEGY
ncbi:RagB/SusD family nutrient uptake outer membrane protein [Candidatus Sulfidibacterium hydrothermale]|uniref:RagB/SusD family nutrient uptake outer membrane protein n=1 Tax=Candidatus Sulfidibacterium hydrothermale TaxID=2875962 RepID=UPI001F0A73CE|nr:RagB/SusD family nutrient uptake outer membrane protein [Candidatus Sulfidibacterium hydrothermale]UBM62631.1 RagB/SusD family nutrient uptake outer membrane protein [Candidatus Sulfidibacterium hydrothermale]